MTVSREIDGIYHDGGWSNIQGWMSGEQPFAKSSHEPSSNATTCGHRSARTQAHLCDDAPDFPIHLEDFTRSVNAIVIAI